MTEYVSNTERDEVMEQVLMIPENHLCFDCGNKNPTWASAYLGILICFDCAARHRSYGTHISFIRSINLDKWNRKTLKSIEITGNKYAKEKFAEYGVNKVSGIYEYSSDLVQKYKAEIADQVKYLLSLSDKNSQNKTAESTTENKSGMIKEFNEVNFDDISVSKPQVEEEKPKEPEYSEPTKFNNFAENVNVKIISTGNEKKSKKGAQKIQKVDFDFDFDNFNNVDFNSFNNVNNNSNTENSNKKTETNFDSSKKGKKNKFEDEEEDYNYNKPKISKEEINKKFANKKAISSEDYANLEDQPNTDSTFKNKLSSMKRNQAISSSDMFGEEEEESASLGSKLKDMALGFTIKAAEKAKEFKDKTSNLINRIQTKYGG